VNPTFDRETWAFLDAIARDNTKATFDARRATYQAHAVAPSSAFVESMATLLPECVHSDLRAEAKVGRSLFRINRDTRFSKDKTPYKTHLDFIFWIGGGPPREQPACIVRLTATQVLLGAGQMGLRGPRLDRYRTRLDSPDDGHAIEAIVTGLQAKGASVSDPDRAKPPRPYPRRPSSDVMRFDRTPGAVRGGGTDMSLNPTIT
jgi:uncharacterized protein (TIGR02453 family)